PLPVCHTPVAGPYSAVCEALPAVDISPFFLQGSGDHRHLHSFPTRRSSDLSRRRTRRPARTRTRWRRRRAPRLGTPAGRGTRRPDRKSTRLNSSHGSISYAVFCLKKKKKSNKTHNRPSTTTRVRNHAPTQKP